MTSSTMDNNILSLKLADYTPVNPSEKVDKNGWVNYGDKNLLPIYIRDLAQTSPVHHALCTSISQMIAGKNIVVTNSNTSFQDRLDSLKVYDVVYGCANDLKVYGGYYIEVIYSIDKESIAKINHIPFEECRIAIDIETEDITGIYHSNDWSATKKKKNKPLFIPKFNTNKRNDEHRQVYWSFYYTSGQVYPRPDYWGAVNYIELQKQIGIYHCSNIMSGLFPSFIINFYNGETDIEKQRKMMMDWENKLSGARNSGKFIMTFNEPEAQKTEVVPFPITDADKQYQFLSTESRNEIMVAHRITTPLLFGIREQSGFGSNKDEMETGLSIFINQVIEPAQRRISQGIEEIFSIEQPNLNLVIVPNTPIKTKEMLAAESGDANVSSTALNGAQISSMIEILIQSATGIIPVPSAKGVMKASFPTLSDAQIESIFTGIVAGSVNPNEVAMNSLRTLMLHLSYNDKPSIDKSYLAEDSYKPTEEMKTSAELGLKWRDEYNRGGTEVGVARARDISNMRNLSIDTIKRMYSYFSRHEVDKKATGWNKGEDGFPTAGRIAWELWGGDAGQDWSARIVERIDANLSKQLPEELVADKLIAKGEELSDEWFKIDEYEVDYDTDDAENMELESIQSHHLATSVLDTSVNKVSEQDKRVNNKLFLTRYRYSGSIDERSRPFCKKMMKADRLYRKEDIVAAEDEVVNSGWGAYGSDTYSIWLNKCDAKHHKLYKGGGNCRHFWKKEVFLSRKYVNIDIYSSSAKQMAVKEAEKLGYRVRNEGKVSQKPMDMDYNGFLPDNPVWGRNGSARK